ncbi:MAG TPA: tetraacyldisaccharide 4'-kinase [Acidobacteriaceae bacterium]|nr:tetraacyldisaccharide 4'-kinase [Acidobacteriaceae bacterium]
MMRPFAFLVPVYAAGVAAKNAAYDRGWAEAKRLRWPVVSVGNLSVGGSGKTPVVIRLAQLLKADGVPVDVLSRGYGRNGVDVERVDADGDAARYGDEPVLIARTAGVPVYVGASRYEAGLLAERDAVQAGIHLLDDGFQHRKLARAMDIVVLHASDFVEGLLPAGRLREPLSALKRARVVVLREEDRDLEAELRRRGIAARVWVQSRRLVVESEVGRAVAFCGIARPEEFFDGLRAQGVDVAATRALGDHQRYSAAEIERLAGMLNKQGADCFVTTEKDAARLTAEQRRSLEAKAPVRVARLVVELENEAAVARELHGLLVRK